MCLCWGFHVAVWKGLFYINIIHNIFIMLMACTDVSGVFQFNFPFQIVFNQFL